MYENVKCEKNTLCCGFAELEGFNNNGPYSSETMVKEFAVMCEYDRGTDRGWLGGDSASTAILSVAYQTGEHASSPYSKKEKARIFAFQKYCADHGLGKVVLSDETVNPNSDNKLITGLWTVEQQALADFCEEKGWHSEGYRDCDDEFVW